MLRRRRLLCLAMGSAATITFLGCSAFRDGTDGDASDAMADLMSKPKMPDVLGQAIRPFGLAPALVVGVGAVNSLPHTGGAADPSEMRDELLEEIKFQGVAGGEGILESDSTALIQLQAAIPAAARKGDLIDVKIASPPSANATDLSGGWLLDTRMQQQLRVKGGALTGPSLRKSDTVVVATGLVLTKAVYDGSVEEADRLEGIVIQGGTVQKDRPFGIKLRSKYSHVRMATEIEAAINRRFFFFDGSSRRGIASAANDDFISLDVPPQYRPAIPRLIAVVSAMPMLSKPSEVTDFLNQAADDLTNPATAKDAALALEAIGDEAVPTLLQALDNPNPEIQFYTATSLAYLGQTEAVDALETAIKNTPAFRAEALKALESLSERDAILALRRLLDVPSIETRYGAFCVLKRLNAISSAASITIASFKLYPSIAKKANPAIVISLRERPEVVLFGPDAAVQIKTFLRGPKGVLVRTDGKGGLTVDRFTEDDSDQHAEAKATVAGLVKALASVGLTYGDVIECLQLAKKRDAIDVPLIIDPLPETRRTYYRDDETTTGS